MIGGNNLKEKSAVNKGNHQNSRVSRDRWYSQRFTKSFEEIMETEFIIPLSKDDLLCAEGGSYVVEEILTVRCLPGKISDAVISLENNGPCAIIEEFDVFFSVVKHFPDISNQVKFECWQNLHKALAEEMNILITVTEGEDIGRDIKKQHRNILKMLCYLLTHFTEEFEAEDCKPSTLTASCGRGRGKNSKAKKQSILSFDWAKTKEEFLRIVTQLLKFNIASLWDPPVIEEEFVNTFANCCYKFLENPNVTRDKTLRDSIVDIIGILVKKYNHSLSVCVKVVQLLQHFEHLISPMAQLVQVCAMDYGVKSIVVEIMREIGQTDPRDLARDTSGTKCYSDFLVELASRIPEHILPNISLLLCHLDGESYSMRNGVLGVMGEVVILRLSQDELDENSKKTRDQILDRLEEHLHDVHAFVRSKVLQIWQNICRAKAIPLARQQHLLELVIARLKDKSSMVRKNAVHFLKEILISNPFGAKLPLEQAKKKLEEETEKLKQMAPELVEEQNCEVPVESHSSELKCWTTLESDIRVVVEEHWELDDIVDEDGEHIEFQGDVNEALEFALMNIKRHLNTGNYEKALAILKAALVTWPHYSMFSSSHERDKTGEPKENKSEHVETLKNKDRKVERELSFLKTIFLNPQFGPVTIPERPAEERENQSVVLSTAKNVGENPEDARMVNEVSKQQMVIQYLKDYVSFHTNLQDAVVVICQLLGSKTTTDVQEAIEFLVIAYEFGLSNAFHGVRRMLLLVWSKDNSIKDSVVEAYERLYLNPHVQGQRARAAVIVRNLIALTHGASIGELTSLDELVYKLMKSKLIPNNVIQLLWEKFTMKAAQTTQEESRSALKLLGMLARAEYEIVQSNIDVLVNTGLGDRARDDALLVKNTCTVLLKLNKDGERTRGDNYEPLRFSADHMIFQRLADIVVSGITLSLGGMWVPMAEEAINVIYHLAEHPDEICGNLIKSLIFKIFDSQTNIGGGDEYSQKETQGEDSSMSCSSHVLARLLGLAGHIALRQVVHLDSSILGEIKRRERVKEDEKGKQKNKNRTSSSVQRSETTNATPKPKETSSEALEDELGLTGATAEDTEAEYIKKICDHEIVTGNNLLSILSPLIVTVCNNPTKYTNPQLRAAASLALAKYMLVSSEFCEKNLQLLFTILEKSPHPVIRANTIISLGDLTFRFPNLIEPWTPNLYARLRDESVQVRKNTLMVLTHLILNDMVKVKGQISEMATCLEDKDQRIADLAKLFFLELSKKGNAIYNILPDVISRLSDPDSGIQEEPFRNIMRYLFSFIQKDRQCESLVEKLCHRFRATRTERQWRDLAFCLAQLSYNERGVRKLQENFACFQDKLSDENVYDFFNTIMGKCKKFAKPEMKVVVEELEARIVSCHEKGVEDEAGYERANQASAAARILVGRTPAARKARSNQGRTPASSRRTMASRGRTPASRRRKGNSESEDIPKSKPLTAKKSGKKNKKKVIVFESDDEGSLDMFAEEDWDDVFVDKDSDDSDNEENVNPNVRSVKALRKPRTPSIHQECRR